MDQKFDFPCRYEKLDIVDEAKYRHLVKDNNVNYIVHLAGILSAAGEKNPDLAIDVNVLEYYSFSGSKYNQEHCVGSVCSHMHRQLKM